jgi:hypothetical protein
MDRKSSMLMACVESLPREGLVMLQTRYNVARRAIHPPSSIATKHNDRQRDQIPQIRILIEVLQWADYPNRGFMLYIELETALA